MDLTQVFKASVMAVKLQRKHDLQPQAPDKNRILPTKGAGNSFRDDFSKQTKQVCQKITQLRNVLLENRGAYMKIAQHLKGAAHMTDQQRDLIDRESSKFVTFYMQHLGQLRADWKAVKRKPQHRRHMEAVFELLEAYLKSVQTIYEEQKKYRVQHELETYRLLKLAADKKQIPIRPGSQTFGKKTQRLYSVSSEDNHNDDDDTANERDVDEKNMASRQKKNDDDSDNSSDLDWNAGWEDVTSETPLIESAVAKTETDANKPASMNTSQKVAIDEDMQKSLNDEEEAHELSPEDIQMYEQENVQLYQELQGLEEEVEQIEKNVVDIARLQDIFTEKVTLQHHNIDRIANAVVGATENVKDANEQIKQAIQRNAGLRVWILFFLLVMSFALLFLDWFYD